MSIQFKYLPPTSPDCFVTKEVPTTPVVVVIPAEEAAPKREDVLRVMQGNADLARNCRTQPQNTSPFVVDGVLDDAAFQNLPSQPENKKPATTGPSHKFLPLGRRQSPGIEIDRDRGSIEAIQPPSLSTQSGELPREPQREEFMGRTTNPIDSPPLRRSHLPTNKNPMEPIGKTTVKLLPISPLEAANQEKSLQAIADFGADMEAGIPPSAHSTNEKKVSPPSHAPTPQLMIAVTPPATPVQKKAARAIFSITSEDGLTKEYYRPQITVRDLLTTGKSLAETCNYPDVTVVLDTYKKGSAYACITFRKRIDHAEQTYRELCHIYSIPKERRVDLAPLRFAVGLKKFASQNTHPEIEHLERQRTASLLAFTNEFYANGAPKDPALERVYRPTHEQRLALLDDDHPNPIEYIASTDCVMFVYKLALST